MAKTRDKVQQIGFWDSEVKNPDHDAVCLWAYNNAEAIFRIAHPEEFDRDWEPQDIDSPPHNDSQRDSILEATRAFAKSNRRPNPRISNKSLEHVLRSYTGFRNDIERIVGYADLLIEIALPRVTHNYIEQRGKYPDYVFVDCDITWSSEHRSPRIVVEAKSVLPTIGELMRQIQLYRTAFRGKFVVVSPDASYSQILAEQGVLFVQYMASSA